MAPITPDSDEEWELEQRAFIGAGGDGVPTWAREVISDLWREVVSREAWYNKLNSVDEEPYSNKPNLKMECEMSDDKSNGFEPVKASGEPIIKKDLMRNHVYVIYRFIEGLPEHLIVRFKENGEDFECIAYPGNNRLHGMSYRVDALSRAGWRVYRFPTKPRFTTGDRAVFLKDGTHHQFEVQKGGVHPQFFKVIDGLVQRDVSYGLKVLENDGFVFQRFDDSKPRYVVQVRNGFYDVYDRKSNNNVATFLRQDAEKLAQEYTDILNAKEEDS